MRHHRPWPRSCSQALAASSGQGEGDSSTTSGGDGGAVKPPRNDVHDAIMNRVMEYTQKETRWIEERMEKKMGADQGRIETQLKEMKTELKELKAGQEKMGEGLEKKIEAGQERTETLLKELKTGQENQFKELKTGLEKVDSKIQILEKVGIGSITLLVGMGMTVFVNFIKPLVP